jgi:peptide/nickel transport system substrate-binding protein
MVLFKPAFARSLLCSAVLALSLSAGAAHADDPTLTIGLAGAVTSVDPHFFNATPNHVVAHSLFDRLTERAPDGALKPGLALSWKPISDQVWEFKLRPDVKWHDGKPFTAEDVVFTFTRARNVPNSPGGFGGFLRDIAKVEVIDPLTVHLHTGRPTPNLPRELAFVAIVSKHAGEGATTEGYNAGDKAIGTGPYKFSKYTPGDRVELVRNDDWWGDKQPWSRVTIRFITNPASRVSALLAGDVDIIDALPATNVEQLKKDARVDVATISGMRLLYLAMDVGRKGNLPLVTDNAGKPLETNPFLDVKVRQALSVAINRQALAERVMQNTAMATGQWLPKGTYSYANSVAVPTFDTARAKTLLSEAGYPEGFKVTLYTPNDRYPNDSNISQAVAQMWSRAGVATQVEAMPWATYVPRSKEFPVALWGWGSPTLEAGYLLANVVSTPDAKLGRGNFNYGQYSNPKLDELTTRALSTLDDDAREKLLIEAVEMVSADVPMIPLLQLNNFWAVRKGITFDPRMDERTLAVDARPAK